MPYYENTVQVRFWDYEIENYSLGIAFHNYVIRATDGEPFEIDDLYYNADGVEEDDIIIEMSWNDLTKTTI